METLYVTSFTVLQRGIILSNTFSVTQLYDKYLNILVAIVYELRLTCYFNIYKLLLILILVIYDHTLLIVGVSIHMWDIKE